MVIKEFINKIRLFLGANPRRAKLIGIIIVLSVIPITVVAALTIQNLQQHAGGGNVVRISDQNNNTLYSTSDPNVFIDIQLNATTKWTLPNQPSANNGLVKNAYAQSSCQTDSDCSFSETCVGSSSNNSLGTFCLTKNVGRDGSYCGTPSGTANNSACNSSICDQSTLRCILLPTPTPTPIPFVSPTPTRFPPGVNLNPTPTPTPTTKPNSPTPTAAFEPTATPTNSLNAPVTTTPPKNILRAIYIENLDQDGSTGGSAPRRIMVNSNADLARITWKLNDLLLGQNQAPRTVQITLIGDNVAVPFATTVNLMRRTTSTNILSRVDISLDCSGKVLIGQECHASALAYDTANFPMLDSGLAGLVYSWGISSSNSIGTLSKTTGNITSFYAQNIGMGSIWVIAQQGNNQVQKAIVIEVLMKELPKPSPTNIPIATISSTVKTCSISKGDVIRNYCAGSKIITVFSDGRCGEYESQPYDCAAVKKVCSPTQNNTDANCGKTFDLNEDGIVNCKDVKILISQYGQKGIDLPADLNNDKTVDGIDYNTIARNFTPGDTTVCAQ